MPAPWSRPRSGPPPTQRPGCHAHAPHLVGAPRTARPGLVASTAGGTPGPSARRRHAVLVVRARHAPHPAPGRRPQHAALTRGHRGRSPAAPRVQRRPRRWLTRRPAPDHQRRAVPVPGRARRAERRATASTHPGQPGMVIDGPAPHGQVDHDQSAIRRRIGRMCAGQRRGFICIRVDCDADEGRCICAGQRGWRGDSGRWPVAATRSPWAWEKCPIRRVDRGASQLFSPRDENPQIPPQTSLPGPGP